MGHKVMDWMVRHISIPFWAAREGSPYLRPLFLSDGRSFSKKLTIS